MRTAHGAARSRTRIALALVLAVFLTACGSGGDEQDADRVAASAEEIEISVFVFQPKSVKIARGTTVRWTNGDEILHTVTSGVQKEQGIPGVAADKAARPDGTFDLELDGGGTEASFTFEEAGTYTYFCRLHAAMTGRIVVA
jgi:plastocyanin